MRRSVRVAFVVALLALAGPAGASAAAPSLKLKLPGVEAVGSPISVTATGVGDGTLRLFLYADEQRRPCAATPALERPGSLELTPAGGEAVAAGDFSVSYSYTPARELAELCAYLDLTAEAAPAVTARTPDPVQEYLESAKEAEPIGYTTEELPGAIKPRPVNQQLMDEYWARVDAEAQHHAEVRSAVRPCVVPRLRGHTLAGARRLLDKAGCALGSVRRRHRGGRLVVVAQGWPVKHLLEGGAAVAVVLGRRSH